MSAPRVLATLGAELLRGAEHADLEIDVAEPGRQAVARVLLDANRPNAFLLDGSERADQAAAAVLALRRPGVPLVLAECAWQRGTSRVDALLNRIGQRAIDRAAVTYCVISSAELGLFPQTWSVAPDRVAFTPYRHTLGADELRSPCPPGSGVFAGGDSLRDYGPLVQAVVGLEVPVTLATAAVDGALPRNVRAGRVPHARFLELLRAAAVVVVGLRAGIERSAGQQTYLNAMALGKVIIVSDSPGARDHVEHGHTGLIVPPGDARELGDALRWALDPAHRAEVDAMRGAARDLARTAFSPERYAARLLDVVAAALAAQRRPAAQGRARAASTAAGRTRC